MEGDQHPVTGQQPGRKPYHYRRLLAGSLANEFNSPSKRRVERRPPVPPVEWARRSGPGIRYEVIIYWSDEDQAFIAEVPQLPGCAADGQTYQEALASAETVIREWIETAKDLVRPIPQPKGRLLFA